MPPPPPPPQNTPRSAPDPVEEFTFNRGRVSSLEKDRYCQMKHVQAFAENVKTRRYIVLYLCELGIFLAPYPKQVSHVKAMLRGPFVTTIRRDTELQHCFELLHHCSNIVAVKNFVANISLINKEDQFQTNY